MEALEDPKTEPFPYALGDRVKFTRHLERHGRYADRISHKVWEKAPTDYLLESFPEIGKEKVGIVIGVRTLADGYNTYDYDSGTEFHATGFFQAALVVFDLRRKPVFVLLEDLQPVKEEG